MANEVLIYPILDAFNQKGDSATGTYKGYDEIEFQPGINRLLFKFEVEGVLYYLPTEADLNNKLRPVTVDDILTITYIEDQLVPMAGTFKIFEVNIQA